MTSSEHNSSSSSSSSSHTMTVSEHNSSSSSPHTMSISENKSSSSSSSLPILRTECKKAIDLFNGGKLRQGLEMISQICDNNSNIGFPHRLHAELCLRAASVMEEPTRSSLEKIAVKLARTAVTLSPNSLEFAYFYVKLLFQFSHDQVVQESIRALSIKDPTDPTMDDLTNHCPQISPEARNATLRHSIQNHLKQCVNFHGYKSKKQISENPLEYNKEFVRTPKNQPLEGEIEERLACNRNLRRGTDNSNVRNGDNIIQLLQSKDSQIAAQTAKILELEKKVSKMKERDSLYTKRDGGATLMFIAITIFVGFISGIYLSNNCIMSKDIVAKIMLASIIGILLFGFLALGRILETCYIEQPKNEVGNEIGDIETGDDYSGVDLESGSAHTLEGSTSRTSLLPTGGRSKSGCGCFNFNKFGCFSCTKFGSCLLQTLFCLGIIVVCGCSIYYILIVYSKLTTRSVRKWRTTSSFGKDY